MGTSHKATWSLDSKQHREAKAFCCINAVAEDFALFGQLYLNNGMAGGHEVVPSNWVRESLTIRNDSRDSQRYPYTYLWRVMSDGSFFAKGILGQYIFVCPQKKLVIVRMGESEGNINWPEFFRFLTERL
jgi:CubicO group peptidase (beta-lactamase class C family)